MSSYQMNASQSSAGKKENTFLRSVKPPKTASGVAAKRTKGQIDEQAKIVRNAQDEGTKTDTTGIKQKGHGGIRDKKVINSSSSSVLAVNGSNSRKSNSSKVALDVNNAHTNLKNEYPKGTTLSSKAKRFTGYSAKRPVLSGQKISVKQLDEDSAYLQ